MNGLKLNELVAGEIYECRLTKRLVMVINSEPVEYDTPKYGKIKSWYMSATAYNPVTGRTEDIMVHENQLIKTS